MLAENPPAPGKSKDQVPTKSAGLEPLHLLAIAAVIAAGLFLVGDISDVNDVFIHVLLGEQLLDSAPFSELGQQFSFTVDNPDWRTGAWGSEALMALTHRLGGWGLLIAVFRIGSLLAIAGVLSWGVLRRYPSRAAVPAFCLAMFACAISVEERPQSISYIFIALVGVWSTRALTEGYQVKVWVVALTACLWANLHGLWVLLPAVLLLVAVGRYIDAGLSDAVAKRTVIAAAAAVVGGFLTPLGVAGLFLPFELQSAARGAINEWQKTMPLSWEALPLLVVALSVVFLLGRSRARPSILLYAGGVLTFGLLATRNVTPTVLLLTPLLASLLTVNLRKGKSEPTARLDSPRLATVATSCAVVGALLITSVAVVRSPGPGEDLPVALIEDLNRESGPIRLLNDYNLSGIALFYGSPLVQVAIDGRADYYGSQFVNEYVDATVHGRSVTSFLDSIDPTHALVFEESAVAETLAESGWEKVSTVDDWVLLRDPGAVG